MKIFILFITLLTPFYAGAQEIKWSVDRPLTWNDFTGRPDDRNPFMAYTDVEVGYSYNTKLVDGVYTLTFQIEHHFLKNGSWSKKDKQTPTLLKHEQLHFDLNEYYARILYRELTNKTYTANYQVEVRDIFAAVTKKMKSEQLKYDAETQHSINKEKQADWEAMVKQQLEETPTYQ